MIPEFTNLAIGYALGLSLAAPPGPTNAVIAVEATRRGWWSGVRVGLGATFGDVIYLTVFALGLGALLSRSPTMQGVLNFAGAAIMAYIAWGAIQTVRTPPADPHADAPTERAAGFLAGLGLVLTSPYNVAWWSTAGASLLARLGAPVIVGLFAAVLTWVTVFPAFLRFGETRVQGLSRIVAAVSAVVLVAFAAWFLWQGARLLV